MSSYESLEELASVRKSITVRGLSGLQNIGNTCYMNSVLQCLSHTSLLQAYVLNKKFIKQLTANSIKKIETKQRKSKNIPDDDPIEVDSNDVIKSIKFGSVMYNYYKLLSSMWSENKICIPRSFKDVIGRHNKLFNGSKQNDSQELLSFVLNTIHEELKKEIVIKYKQNKVPSTLLEFRKRIEIYKDFMSKNDDKIIHTMNLYKEYLNTHMEDFVINSSLEYMTNYIQNGNSIYHMWLLWYYFFNF